MRWLTILGGIVISNFFAHHFLNWAPWNFFPHNLQCLTLIPKSHTCRNSCHLQPTIIPKVERLSPRTKPFSIALNPTWPPTGGTTEASAGESSTSTQRKMSLLTGSAKIIQRCVCVCACVCVCVHLSLSLSLSLSLCEYSLCVCMVCWIHIRLY